MSHFKRISKLMNSGTKSEKKIVEYLLSNFPYSAMESLKVISEKTQVSIPTIQRMTIKMGYQGFPDFKQKIMEESAKEKQTSPLTRMSGIENSKGYNKNYLQTIKNIETTFTNLPDEILIKAARCLADESKPIWCLGGRFTGALTTLFARHLKTIRTRVREYNSYEGALADVYLNTDDDTVLFITDIRRYDQPITTLCEACKKEGATIILVTDNWHSPAEKYADMIIPVYTTLNSGWDSNACLLIVLEEIMGILTDMLGEEGREQLSKRENFVNKINKIN